MDGDLADRMQLERLFLSFFLRKRPSSPDNNKRGNIGSPFCAPSLTSLPPSGPADMWIRRSIYLSMGSSHQPPGRQRLLYFRFVPILASGVMLSTQTENQSRNSTTEARGTRRTSGQNRAELHSLQYSYFGRFLGALRDSVVRALFTSSKLLARCFQFELYLETTKDTNRERIYGRSILSSQVPYNTCLNTDEKRGARTTPAPLHNCFT